MPERIRLSRAKGWRMPLNTVNVARGPGRRWGNPFTVEAAREVGYSNPHLMAVVAFKDWLAGDPWACGSHDDYEDHRQAIIQNIDQLTGRNLACWCALDAPCHADVLLELANSTTGVD